MKKIIFTTLILIMMISMVACSNTDNTNGVDIPMDVTITTPIEEEVIIPQLPELSDEFANTALQFIDEYSTPSKELENLAAEAIQQSNGFKDGLYTYLNYYLVEEHGEEIRQFFGYLYDEVYTVDVWIHNYEVGGDVGCVSYNGQDAVYNYDHNPLLLSAGVLGDTYPDNITLAEARIASYVLLQMDTEDVDCCIVTTNEGKKSYDFTFKNEAFKDLAREILQDLSKS